PPRGSLPLWHRRQLLALTQAIEAPGLPGEVGEPRRAEEPLFQPAAVRVGQAARRAIALRLLDGQVLHQPVTAEDQLPQPRGHRALVLEREQERGAQVLVHLSLQLQLELRHRARAAGAEDEIDEVADLLRERAEGAQVLRVEEYSRVGAGQALADAAIQD